MRDVRWKERNNGGTKIEVDEKIDKSEKYEIYRRGNIITLGQN